MMSVVCYLGYIDSLSAAQMAKYSLVITPTPCRVAGGIYQLGVRIDALVHLLTCLLTYTVGSGV